jgi:hypothetical protein
MTPKPTLQHIIEALEVVYGPFTDLSEAEAAKWTPPDKPGAGGHRGRYLWTDAFGVVDFLTLYKETGSAAYLELAKSLVRTVHAVLGRTRDGSSRLPGATDDAPLAGGLRIGKVDAAGADGDGQYHHYLTLWMFALNRLALAAADGRYNDLAVQLARAIHPAFVLRRDYDPSAPPHMVWKVSTDMRRVLVPSEGHLDAATGYVVYRILQRTAAKLGRGDADETVLKAEIDDYRQMAFRKGKMSASNDMLDLGMGLWMCHFFRDEAWAAALGEESLMIARRVLAGDGGVLGREASHRLAFREFGACLGINCYGGDASLQSKVDDLIKFWERYIESSTEEDLRPISLVMYAAALNSGAFRRGYLGFE